MTPAEIIAIIELASALIAKLDEAIKAGKERGEWTPEQEAEFDAKLAQAKQTATWWRV